MRCFRSQFPELYIYALNPPLSGIIVFCLFNAREQQSICQTEKLCAKHELSPVKKIKCVLVCICVCVCVCIEQRLKEYVPKYWQWLLISIIIFHIKFLCTSLVRKQLIINVTIKVRKKQSIHRINKKSKGLRNILWSWIRRINIVKMRVTTQSNL